MAEILYPKTENMNAQMELNPFGFGLFLDAYSLVKVAAWQSSNIGCFFVAYF